MKSYVEKIDVWIISSKWFLLMLVAPLALMLVRVPLLYFVMLEEAVKYLAVLGLIRDAKRFILSRVMVAGGLFGMSESFLYLLNVNIYGELSPWWGRILMTVPMHILSIIIIYGVGRFGGVWWLVAYVTAVIFHYGFNLFWR